ncbi:MAG: hypothetical protein JXA10_02430 [Anaerolineae bacterium]|nr:hypothetical protein [Anaerolineae bacterium]
MDSLTREDIKGLIETEGEWCVSLFMPTVRAGAEVQQNPIRLKNLLRKAEERLAKLQMRAPDIETMLRPAANLLDDPDHWRGASDGLAVFIAPDAFHSYRLPVAFDELVVAERGFHIKPLLPVLSNDGRFYVLALSQDQVRLLEGTRHSVNEIEVASVPGSLVEALQYDREGRVQMRAASGGQGAVYQGAGEEEAKQEILRYFQMVDRGLHDVLAEEKVPLVLAGVDYLLPIYHEANTYNHLLAKGITGNPESLSAKDLHKRAWGIVEPHFAQAQAEQRDLYFELAGREDERASNVLKTTVRAAVEGRVATLFVASGVQKWGVYRAHSHKVHVHPTQQPGDQDLLDVAAAQTFASGGLVFAVAPDQVPGDEEHAAIFRY